MRRFWAAGALVTIMAVAAPAVAANAARAHCRHWEGDPTTPCLVVTPLNGPVGTHVRFHGTVPHDQINKYNEAWHNQPFYGLTGEFPSSSRFPQGCELILPAKGLRIALDTLSGAVRGSFTVGSRGTCSQDGGTPKAGTKYDALPGRYSLFVGSLSTYIANFRVTPGQVSSPAKTAPPKKPTVAPKPQKTHKPAQPHAHPPTPTHLPFTGPPLLQMTLLAGAAACAGLALTAMPRAPRGRHRAA